MKYVTISVCVNVLTKFGETLSNDDRKNKDTMETKLRKFCKDAKGKDERFVCINDSNRFCNLIHFVIDKAQVVNYGVI